MSQWESDGVVYATEAEWRAAVLRPADTAAAEEIPDGYAAVRPPVAQDPDAIPDPYAVVLEQGRQANMVKQFRSISQ